MPTVPRILRKHWRGVLMVASLLLAVGLVAVVDIALGQGAPADPAAPKPYITEADLDRWALRQIGILVLGVWVPLSIAAVGLAWRISDWRSKTAEAIDDNAGAVAELEKKVDDNAAIQAGQQNQTQRLLGAIAEALISSSALDDDARKRLTRQVLNR